MIEGGPEVTALGGGHGLAATLGAARRYAGSLTAVVSVADDGGSSGRLREMTGMPAPGDLRRCLGALADPESLWARAFEHRFASGELDGHAFGNLVIAVLSQVSGDFTAAVELAARLLQVEGEVLPATSVPSELRARTASGEVVGQVNVATSIEPIERLSVWPPGAPTPSQAVEAVRNADQVILGPGSLYTSVLAAAIVPALAGAIAGRQGGRIFVANLHADEPEAGGYEAFDQLRVIEDHGIVVDAMIYDPRTVSSLFAISDNGAEWVRGVRCVAAPVGRTDGVGHDIGRLSLVLADLANHPG